MEWIRDENSELEGVRRDCTWLKAVCTCGKNPSHSSNFDENTDN